ncbi:MAG: LuxR C-terminal-related transcriptional regulator [Ginsengibacter sp.]
MKSDIAILHNYWLTCQNKTKGETALPKISFDKITNSLFGVGNFYYYIIDFFDMSVSHVSSSVRDIHGFDPLKMSFNDVLNTIHPEDISFVNKAEAASLDFVFKNFGPEQILSYKISYNFRSKMKNGEYAMLNHQALILTLDESGGYGKSLNIHTRIDHLCPVNPGTFSLIGLNENPSYLNLSIEGGTDKKFSFSKREIDIIKLISDGENNETIAQKLNISVLTVKTHRRNILSKSNCKNTAQLIKKSMVYGII